MSKIDDLPPMATVPYWMRIVGVHLDGVLDSGFLEAVRDARLHLRHDFDDPDSIEDHAAQEYDLHAGNLENWRGGDLAMLQACSSALSTLSAYIELSEILIDRGHEEGSATMTGDDVLDEMLERLSWSSVSAEFPVDTAESILESLRGAVVTLESTMASAPAPPSE